MPNKRILIITYYWPPSGGGGVQRWLKMSKYLPELGWDVFVYTPENPFVSEKDPSLMSEVHSNVKVIKSKIWEPYRLLQIITGKKRKFKQGVVSERPNQGFIERILIWSRANLFLPDPRVFWVKPSVKKLKGIILENEIDVVISTGPPHSMHLIVLELKKELPGIKWVADFRDPWSKWDILEQLNLSERSARTHKRYEKKVLTNADTILTVSPSWAEDFKSLGANNVQVIMNGFDPDDFVQFQNRSNRPVICHFGLLNEFRNYQVLWKALDTLANQGIDFELRMGGMVDDSVLKSIAGYTSLNEKLVLLGYISHQEVIKQYEEASLLLLLTNNSTNVKGHLPGKLFEYIGSKKPILVMGKRDSDVGTLIEENRLGIVHEPDDSDYRNLGNQIQLMINDFSFTNADTSLFNRRILTQRLVDILDILVS